MLSGRFRDLTVTSEQTKAPLQFNFLIKNQQKTLPKYLNNINIKPNI